MTSVDDKLGVTAYRLISKYGSDAVFYVDLISDDDYDPETGHTTPDTPTLETVKAAPPELYSEDMIDGTAIMTGDVYTMIATQGLTFTPIISMKLDLLGSKWKIVEVEPLYTGEEIAAWVLQLRK